MKSFNYEKAIQRIETIVDELQKGELGLDESLKLYEEGVRLTSQCNKYLDEAKLKIMKLSEIETNGEENDE